MGTEAVVIRGSTFHRPWGEAVVGAVPDGATAPGPKLIDNRTRAPGAMVGRYLAIRTAQAVSEEGLAWLNEHYKYGWTKASVAPAGFIIGVARVTGVVTEGEHPWYFGPMAGGRPNFGWVLADAVALERPFAFTPKFCRGLFKLPPNVLDEVRRQTGLDLVTDP